MQKRWLVIGATILAIIAALLLFNFLLSQEQLIETESEAEAGQFVVRHVGEGK